MNILQIFAILFGLFALSRAILRAKDQKLSVTELIFWMTIWGGMIFVVFFPGLISLFADLIGIGRGIDIIIYTSIGLLFYLIFRLYVKLEENEMHLTQIVRELSLQSRNKKRK